MVDVVACIFARGGSKGLPRKNLRLLGGKALLVHAIEAARASQVVSRVIVSTDDVQIADVARANGAEVPFIRPSELASDDVPEWLAWRHAVQFLHSEAGGRPPDVFVSVPPTAPLRAPTDIDGCVQTLLAHDDADVVLTVCRSSRSPYFNMVTVDDRGMAGLVNPPTQSLHRRQDAPRVWDITTVAYAVRPRFVLSHNGLFEGGVRVVEVPPERAVDIDSELDLVVAECLYRRSHLQERRGT